MFPKNRENIQLGKLHSDPKIKSHRKKKTLRAMRKKNITYCTNAKIKKV